MLVLGLSGMFATPDDEYINGLKRDYFHDSAACLVDGSAVVGAVEEERLNRVKHTNLFPQQSARACLRTAGVRLRDVDRIAFFWDEQWLDQALGESLRRPSSLWHSVRDLVADRLSETFREEVDPARLDFWQHHRTHAASTFYHSGWDEALVVVADGNGEAEAVSVYQGRGTDLTLLRSYPLSDSLGHYYTTATKMLGYRVFDEYKVMGLAPYGDPSRYRQPLESLTTLAPDGEYHLDIGGLRPRLHAAGYVPRHGDELFSQDHKDFAAAVQENLERVMRHILGHWAERTGNRNLCLAGGVAQNSSMNGGILRSGLFRKVFVHPAGHDAGAAMGAAMLSSATAGAWTRSGTALRDAFLGPGLEDEEGVLREWSDFVEWERSDDVCAEAAGLLADGAVLGWARGRSEFGPRALGHRSILADPRPAENRDRVNFLIKEREGYRPFAPAVLEEHAEKYYETPEVDCALDYMGFVLPVRPEKAEELGAVTHVDGTARVQVVRKETNEEFWRLINEFHLRTDVPVILNTSFNNNAEPIVQTARDCVVTFLTTGLDYLVMGDLVVRKREVEPTAVLDLRLSIPTLVEVSEVLTGSSSAAPDRFRIGHRDRFKKPKPISEAAYRFIAASTGSGPSPSDVATTGEERRRLAEEIRRLWQDRLIDLRPR